MKLPKTCGITYLLIILMVLLTACAEQVTPVPETETDDATAVAVVEETEAVESETTEAVSEATAEATEAVAEANAEAAEATDTVTEETAEAEATQEATAEATEAVAEATAEAAEATDTVTEETAEAEATQEATAEATEAVAEATAETTQDAETTAEATEAVTDSEPQTYEAAFSFQYPADWAITSTGSSDTIRLESGEQDIVVVGPTSYNVIVNSLDFESDSDQLAHFLDRSGYDVGEPVETDALASLNIALPRRGLTGTGTLLDLENGRRGALLVLSPEGTDAPTEVAASIVGTLVYPADIIDVAISAEGFNTLVAAVQAADLEDTLRGGEFTVFAPTDAAFINLLDALGMSADELLADTDLLTTVLTYHVVEGTVLAEAVVELDGESVATVNGDELTIGVGEDGVMLTDIAGNSVNVIQTDITASNGVIHVIDAVLLPNLPEPEAEATEEATEETAEATEEATEETVGEDLATIFSLALQTGDLSSLATAVVSADLIDVLDGEGQLTVFAPTNAAFEAALESLGISFADLAADTDLLTSVLTYHVVEGAVFSDDLVEGDVVTVNGAPVTISFAEDGSVMVNGATVITADIAASNGVVHIIDGVLLPPSGE